MSKKKTYKTHPMFSQEYMDIIIVLRLYFDNLEEMQKWLIKNNPNFGGISPAEVITNGRVKVVRDFVNKAIYLNNQLI